MPQMAPMWWELLFILFLSLFILTSMVIYHNNKINPDQNIGDLMCVKNYNWKW